MNNFAHIGSFLQPDGALIILAAALFASLIIRWFFRRLESQTDENAHPWGAAFLRITPRMAQWTLLLFAVTFATDVLLRNSDYSWAADPMGDLRRIGLICIFTWMLYAWKEDSLSIYAKRKLANVDSVDHATLLAISKLSNIILVVTAVMTILPILGVQPATLLAVGGAGALGASLAAKDVISNFFGGFMILVMRPFSEGDWIKSPDKNLEGTVEKVGWYQTRIRAFDKQPIYVPNALFTSLVVVNPSRMSHRRIREDIGIRYDDFAKTRTIVQAIEAMLRKHPGIDQSMTLMVHFTTFEACSLNLNVYCFAATTNWAKWREIQMDVLLKIGEVIDAHGAEIAFPTRTVHVQGGNELIGNA